jgi:hypothetical protein
MNRAITRVEIEYDDGEVRRADGDDADAIWRAYGNAMEFYLHLQRRHYDGPVMRVVREAREEQSSDDSILGQGGSGNRLRLDQVGLSLAELAKQEAAGRS